MLPSVGISPSAESSLPAIPLETFCFHPPVRRLSGRYEGPVARHGEPMTFAVTLDSRDIPFKLLRLDEANPRPVLMLLHGMGLTVASFHPIAPYLFASHDLLLVDYNSFSAAERWPLGHVTLRMLAAGGWKILHTLGISTVSLIGSSLGGGLALLMGLMFPQRVERMILVNPAVYPQALPMLYRLTRTPILGELLMALTPGERLVEGVSRIGYSSPERMPEALRGLYLRNMEHYRNRLLLMDVMRQLPTHFMDVGVPLEMGKVGCPVLLLWGMQERLLVPETGRRLARELGNCRLVEFEDLGHLPHEEAPERLGAVARGFLGER